ncbi:MAG: glucose-1-phosphate adenylyltransferase [Elusimicrobiaceae bacterium]|jgi:glucose-1-phosphate adenylyltransferase|nr:glucose-1-phosphate adenylyltransferase [Elusimicrobiaceae bacterium]MBT3954789.1 glucose-1-phosphate adenylyltransferase [Elusimicrobiaceae bacterium]MBT4008783.1 glucose-1-phosphate adenylyltransferase [Elusimicrobiaceae bacterium]MBT4402273.1 glucose-1-phosphate adenylyltransferase [Elusimicrobiaceae bacterium]MBT4440270.1 glucose-1-phosphate adenylyltransferase [Elusimicrobiaceae bacterium]
MKVLGMIMAGGKGERLYPLTKERSKPSVPFGGKYRIIDFVISNFINSGIHANYILVQYLSQSLIEYLRTSWRTQGLTKEQFITVVPPQMRLGEIWYRGTADAVRQNLNLIKDFAPDLVVIFGSDHIYRMDIRQMIDFHVKNKADITVAANIVPTKQAKEFGVISANSKNKIVGFDEKPKKPKEAPGKKGKSYVSMGNYIFSYDTLIELLQNEHLDIPGLDFGKNVLPKAFTTHNVFAYDFSSQKLPGVKNYEDNSYWQDVGNIETFWQTHMDLLGAEPKVNLHNTRWPIHTSTKNSPPSKMLGGNITNSQISTGCVVHKNAKIINSVIASDIEIEENVLIEDSIVMDSCIFKKGSKIKKTIVDRFNIIEANETVGHDSTQDAQKYFIDPSGIVVVPRGKSKFSLDD